MLRATNAARAALLGVALAAGACGSQTSMKGEPMAPKPIEQVLEERTPELMALPGVVGVARGLCAGRPCIRVFVIRETPELRDAIPAELDGHPVVLEVTGEIRAPPPSPET